MAFYYFDVDDGRGVRRDHFGVDLNDDREARDQCRGLLPDLLCDELPGVDLCIIRCHVRDEGGQVVYKGEITYRGTRFAAL